MRDLGRSAVIAFAGFAGIMAAQCGAAATVKQPKLVQGVLTVSGTPGDDQIAVRVSPADPTRLQVDFGNGAAVFTFARFDVTQIEVDGGAGNDVIRADESAGAFTDTIPTTLDGGAGDDTLTGGVGADTIRGGAANDIVDAGRGNDTVSLGAGDDSFTWDPGEQSDTVDAGAGNDRFQFNGANIAEQFHLSAAGNRLELTRDVGAITMDTSGFEQLGLRALGGADTVTVDDVTKTTLDALDLDLGSSVGGGDGGADAVIVAGTDRKNNVSVTGADGSATVSGLAEKVNVTNAEAANDTLAVETFGGADTIDVSGLSSSVFRLLTLDTGDGNDTVHDNGTGGADTVSVAPNGSLTELSRNGAAPVEANGVENVDVMCGQLAERGVTLLNGPMDRPWGVRTASFRDPGGHIWEIAHNLNR